MTDFSDRMLNTSALLSVVADVLIDVATRLGGEYIHLAETASSPEEERFTEKEFDARVRKRKVGQGVCSTMSRCGDKTLDPAPHR